LRQLQSDPLRSTMNGPSPASGPSSPITSKTRCACCRRLPTSGYINFSRTDGASAPRRRAPSPPKNSCLDLPPTERAPMILIRPRAECER
jgi:hypothetical protein